MAKQKPKTPKRPNLVKLCSYWRTELDLRDWTFKIRYSKVCELDGERKAGTTLITRHKRLAYITILDPKAVDECDWPNIDVEKTLVHELLHCPIETFFDARTRADICAIEWLIDSVAIALVNFKRASVKKKMKPKTD